MCHNILSFRGGDGYFPGAVQEIAVTPIAGKTKKGKVKHMTEQTAVKKYIRRLKKEKALERRCFLISIRTKKIQNPSNEFLRLGQKVNPSLTEPI